MSVMEKITGSADQQLLQEMADHHQGLIAMAQQAAGRGGKEVRADAEMLAKKQQAELEHILGKLQSDFGSDHTPQIDPMSQKWLQELTEMSEADYDAEFRKRVMLHHQEGNRMGERYLPKLSNPALRAMVQRMHAEQSAEIGEHGQKIQMGM